MIEKHFFLDEADPVLFYGPANANLRMLKALCPKLRIMARGNVLKAIGDEEELAAFEELFAALQKHCTKYNVLTEEDVLDIVKRRQTHGEAAEGVIVYSMGGKPITARSENQRRLVEAYDRCDLLFAYLREGSKKGGTYYTVRYAERQKKPVFYL